MTTQGTTRSRSGTALVIVGALIAAMGAVFLLAPGPGVVLIAAGLLLAVVGLIVRAAR